MLAHRFAAFVDACTLVSALKRDLLLSLAAAEFFRVLWSDKVLTETQAAVAKLLTARGVADPVGRAAAMRAAMERAFTGALVEGYELFLYPGDQLPDPNDAHVLAAAAKARVAVIVTENLKDFPEGVLRPRALAALNADAFIADIIDFDQGRAVKAIRTMRIRWGRPAMDAEAMLIKMEEAGLIESAGVLRRHVGSL